MNLAFLAATAPPGSDEAAPTAMVEALHSLRVGITVFDSAERLVFSNEHLNRVFRSLPPREKLQGLSLRADDSARSRGRRNRRKGNHRSAGVHRATAGAVRLRRNPSARHRAVRRPRHRDQGAPHAKRVGRALERRHPCAPRADAAGGRRRAERRCVRLFRQIRHADGLQRCLCRVLRLPVRPGHHRKIIRGIDGPRQGRHDGSCAGRSPRPGWQGAWPPIGRLPA